MRAKSIDNMKRFLSTLSLRRATTPMVTPPSYKLNFYPRSPCGERPFCGCFARCRYWISIHALLAESDWSVNNPPSSYTISIHALLAESDINTYHRIFGEGISIHALLAESDPQNWQKPHGQKKFLSTLSLRRATTLI